MIDSQMRTTTNKRSILRNKWVQRNKDHVNSMKEQSSCFDCGSRHSHYCMDFDHVGEKTEGVSRLLSMGRRLDLVLEEINKCQLVCVLCHRTRTHLRRKSRQFFSDPKHAKRREKRLEIRRIVESIKAGPCIDCGKKYNHWQMEFDHRPGEEKAGSVTELLASLNKNKVLQEISKCDLVCALCHRKRTHVRRDYEHKRTVPGDAGREAWRVHFSILEKDKDAAVKMYLDGKNQQQVAKAFGVTGPVVRELLKERGVRLRSVSEGLMKLLPRQQEEAISLYVGGTTCRVVGERFGVTEDVIRLCLKRHGVAIRKWPVRKALEQLAS